MTKVTKKIRMPPPESFSGKQLDLFRNFLCNTSDERDRLSNTIELWDAVPKYFVTRKKMGELRSDDGFLKSIERTFRHRNKLFTVTIRPARIIGEDKSEQEFYPSAREELVEDALRKIASEQNHGFLETDQRSSSSGVIFTLHMLRQELRRRGYTMSYQQVVESLEVMNKCNIEIECTNEPGRYSSPILPELGNVSRRDYLTNPKARWVARFNSLVTESITALTYRQYDYDTVMRHVSQLARWIHKRLAHNYSNAGMMTPYKIAFSSMKRDSGLLDVTTQRLGVRKLDEALDELQEREVIRRYDKDIARGERGSIKDVVYILTPTPSFIAQVKAANARLSQKSLASAGNR
jgi:hypothetical protein